MTLPTLLRAGLACLVRFSDEQSILLRNGVWNALSAHGIAMEAQTGRAFDVDGEDGIEPSFEPARIAAPHILAARKYGHARRSHRRALDHLVGERPARVHGDDEIARLHVDLVDGLFRELHAPLEPRPGARHGLCDFCRADRNSHIGRDRARRRIIQQEQEVREQPVTACEIHDPAATKTTPNASRHLPCLEELFSRQAFGLADRASHGMKERGLGKAPEIAMR